jgi:hypothetical protein
VGEQHLSTQARQPVDRVAEVQLQTFELVGVLGDPLASSLQHVRRVVGHEIANPRDVVAAPGSTRGGECLKPDLRLLAIPDSELDDVDLVRKLRPVLQPVERGDEARDLLIPELAVGSVGHSAGQRRRVVLLKRRVPRGQMPPVAAVERPHHTLARPHPVLEVDARVDVRNDSECLGEAIDDLRHELAVLHVLRPTYVDRDLRQWADDLMVDSARIPAEGTHHHGGAEVTPVLNPVQNCGQARVVEVHRRCRLGDRGQDAAQILGFCTVDTAQLNHHDCLSVRRLGLPAG